MTRNANDVMGGEVGYFEGLYAVKKAPFAEIAAKDVPLRVMKPGMGSALENRRITPEPR